MFSVDKASEIHQRLVAERCDPASARERLADRLAGMTAHIDASVIRDLVARDSRRLVDHSDGGAGERRALYVRQHRR